MAADSQVTGKDYRCGSAIKVFQNESGLIAGFAGCLGDLSIFRNWFLGFRDQIKPDEKYFSFKADYSEVLLVDPAKADWGAWVISGEECRLAWIEFMPGRKFIAIGSGERMAIGAMAAGASARQALEICAEFDCYTGGEIKTVAL